MAPKCGNLDSYVLDLVKVNIDDNEASTCHVYVSAENLNNETPLGFLNFEH